ncbi:adenosylcobinamide-GDP ribazoletransferase [Geobacillus sp. 46C-IIa]|uniref:adenosylcobinamide-GDP ribazoletransferase n=1 Tax=Geobacillus sp. 46C-IIa TaxID=1963025 RepID=UPI0009BE768F|nr:adenosylcobinamide-GDP ribazoletransferase [Geobacillus sp. 46C-IIa]OQP05975.1 adenosylcobinamide-GDP ribazoletransferase [Geobacillus sp. 46C-IIa]QNU29010.1 adenosylcobinamide-GDP ribazoletransferase [Geobacillus sp. 46C-IIa]
MKQMWNGWLLALQLFTVIPIRRSIEWNALHVRWLVRFMPLAGAAIGVLAAGVYALCSIFSFGSPAFLALLLLWLGIWMAGGLHADGWMDVSDAFFSYRDAKRRQEIMSDSRVGAFAVLSLVCLLSFRWLFLYETIEAGIPPMLFVAVPLLSRTGAAWLLCVGKLAKPTGMAASVREYSSWRDAVLSLALAFLALSPLSVFGGVPVWMSAALVMAMALLALAAKPWAEKQFGGVTGDVLGALIEGGETLLWGVVWLLHSSAMG